MTPDIIRLTPANISLLDAVSDQIFDEPVKPTASPPTSHRPVTSCCLPSPTARSRVSARPSFTATPDKVTELYIDEVGVAPAFQRNGLATRMLDAMFAIGNAEGCGEAWVGTEHDNVAASHLYETHGRTTAEPFVMYIYEL